MQAVMDWMKEFLVVYLILTVLVHLAVSDAYKKYMRFFSGIILLMVLLSPVIGIFGKESRLGERIAYESFWEELDSARQGAKKLEFLQNSHYVRKYEQAIAEDIKASALSGGISVTQASVTMSEDYDISSVSVWLDFSQGDAEAAKEKLLALLKNTYGFKESQISVYDTASRKDAQSVADPLQ